MPAAFGAKVAVGDIEWQARLITFTPLDGCVAPSANDASALAGQMALIKRGTCEFGLKALIAQQAGAVAAVIFNDAIETSPPTMAPGSNGSQV
jgi:extracellular elastinolytic metalloproteinase